MIGGGNQEIDQIVLRKYNSRSTYAVPPAVPSVLKAEPTTPSSLKAAPACANVCCNVAHIDERVEGVMSWWRSYGWI